MTTDRYPEIECRECGWQGDSTELVDVEGETGSFRYCPDCNGTEIDDYED